MGDYMDTYQKEKEERRTWLEGLKAGDKVAMYSGGWQRQATVRTVRRVTAQQIVIMGYGSTEYKFWRKDGDQVGSRGSYSRTYITQLTPAIEGEIALAAAHQRLKYAKWEDFDDRLILEIARRVEAEQDRLEAAAKDGPGKSGDTGE